ncbi:MAG: histidine kinase [Gammaproteobacteria bacterium]|nr:histidine kinase [Gammaproteobacteria bacterium]
MSNNLSFIDLDLSDTGLLPNFCDVNVIFMLVLLVELLALVLTSAPATVNFWDQLAFISMLMLWIGLLNAAVLCQARRWLNSLPTQTGVLLSFILMMLVSLCFSLIVITINNQLLLDSLTSPLGDYFLIRIMLISAVIYAVLLRYFYVQQQWKIHIQAQSKAEIQALRARIRPHFLFNSMNTIASLIAFSPEKAEKAIVDLSDLFRASLREQNTNTLNDELTLTRSYLDIETLRLGERLNIDWNVDESLVETEVPALFLQPLVENAIYHGIEPLADGGTISISARRKHRKLELCVSNPLGDGSISKHESNHMAQENIRQRLTLVYGNDASFIIKGDDKTYTVVLEIPLETPSI